MGRGKREDEKGDRLDCVDGCEIAGQVHHKLRAIQDIEGWRLQG